MSTAISTALPSTASDNNGASSFLKTTKYDPTMMNHHAPSAAATSLLDVIRSQGHVMLADRVKQAAAPLPAVGTSKSKPIRIVSSAQHALNDLEGYDEDPMSTSAELERFYDQSTWRMYVLIQTARQTSHYHAARYPQRRTTTSSSNPAGTQPEWTTSRPPAMELEDDIFDLEL